MNALFVVVLCLFLPGGLCPGDYFLIIRPSLLGCPPLMTFNESTGVETGQYHREDLSRLHMNFTCVLLDLWRGLRNGDRAFPEPRTSTFSLTPALWPKSPLHPKGRWGSLCRTWSTSLPSWQDKWVQRSSRERKPGSCTAWSWQRGYSHSANIKWDTPVYDDHKVDLISAWINFIITTPLSFLYWAVKTLV